MLKEHSLKTSLLLAAIGVVMTCHPASAQLTYDSGQPVSPAYEGWAKNPDGSFKMLFGYMNSNWKEEIDAPVGPDNSIMPSGPDQGQPTHFYPRRNRFVFWVNVPKDFGEKELVWTLTANGKTMKAYGTLKQDYEVNDMVFTSETGAIGAGVSDPEIRRNKPPVVEAVGDTVRTVKVGEPLTLYAKITDDGIPKVRQRGDQEDRRAAEHGVKDLREFPPYQITVGSSTGLWGSLIVYRAAGNVKISPDQVKPWEDTRAGANSQWAPRWVAPPAPPENKWTATAKFDEPGEYILWWHASDGALTADQPIKVKVTK
jgi:hypothetical protein